jgi:hypothetical protein
MPTFGLICSHCNDAADAVTPFNGKSLLASTSHGEIIVALHNRCEGTWADKNDCRTLVPLKEVRHLRHLGALNSGVESERRSINR